MDPFSISTASVGLIASIAALSVQINTFVSQVRDARKDMEAISHELSSLSMFLGMLRVDSTEFKYPESLQQNLVAVMQNCDYVTRQMQDLLQRFSSGRLGRRMQWSVSGRYDMNKL